MWVDRWNELSVRGRVRRARRGLASAHRGRGQTGARLTRARGAGFAWLAAPLILVVAVALLSLAPALALAQEAGSEPVRVLAFTKTAGFRHASIATAHRVLPELAEEYGFALTVTEDAGVFNDDDLAGYDVVAFVLTTGTVLSPEQKGAMERFIRSGGGYVGIHSASDTEYDWPFYGGLVGAYFAGHPPGTQTARVIVEDGEHPSTSHLEDEWVVEDEWYFFRQNPRERVHVLQRLDRTSHPALATFQGRDPREDHPLTWCHAYQGGRSWYTALGHRDEVWQDAGFQRMIAGGILWAAGRADGDCRAVRAGIVREILLAGLEEPLDLEVASDGRVFFVERSGAVKVFDEVHGVRVALKLDVYTENEHGLSGIALDPEFDANGHIYVYYSPAGGGATEFYLSRFTVQGEPGSETIDPASEVILLEVPTDRATCCHVAGDVAIGPDGKLYLATGDNTNPFESDGFAPIDRRPGREFFNAERTAGNLMDLRGKILRINRDGSIPQDNPFVGRDDARPEIWASGFRNPWRIHVDRETGWVLVGNVGPDAGAPNPQRGPAGHDEFEIVTRPGTLHGWPHCIANNLPYQAYDFAGQAPGGFFDCREMIPAVIWYPYGPSRDFPQLGMGGRTAVAGPILRRPDPGAPYQWSPQYLDKWLILEWSRNWIKMVTLDEEGSRALAIEDFITTGLSRPAAMVQAPDGALYLLEYGTEWFRGNPDARLSRIYDAGASRR